MKFLITLLLSLFSFMLNAQIYSSVFNVTVLNNQSLEIPVQIQVFGDSISNTYNFTTESSGFGNFLLQTDFEWNLAEVSITNCNSETLTNYISSLGNTEIEYGVIFNYCDSADVYGCTDPEALNYDPNATADNGSCIYETCNANEVTLSIQTDTWAEEISWNISSNGVELYGDGDYENESEYLYNLCLEDGCYTFELYDSFGDGWNGATYTLTFGDDTLAFGSLLSGANGSINFGINADDCIEEEVLGCTDPVAANYNPFATIDDGSCFYDSTSCEGAEAVLLINNILAADGSWDISNSEGIVFLEGNLEPEFSDYSVCLEDGCYTLNLSDVSISNEGGSGFFTLWAGELLGANDYIQAGSSSYDFVVGNGCDDWISGCTDSLAINYNPDAVFDDGSCEYPPAENDLCADATYIEPGTILINNTQATQNEGIWGECWNFGSGEGEQSSIWYMFTTPAEPASIHFEAIADGSNSLMDTQFGLFLECGGEMIYCDGNSGEGLLSAFDFECGELEPLTDYILMIDGWNGDAGTAFLSYEVSAPCDSLMVGCTDPTAVNYNPDAEVDDGSCIYEDCDDNLVTLLIETNTWAEEISWIISQDGSELYGDGVYENESEYSYNICLEDGCYAFEMFDSFGDGWNGGFFTISMGDTIITQGTLGFGEYGSISFGINAEDCGENEIFGCTDPAAVNYNPLANIDDGTCLYIDSCDIIIEPNFVTCSSYEFLAVSTGGDIIEGGTWSINSGDPIDSNNSSFFWEFDEPGFYTVCFVGQTTGCNDTWIEACSTIYIDPGCFNPCPQIAITSSDSCTFTFILSDTDSLSNITWFPGDGNAYEGGNTFTFTYQNTGFYTVCAAYDIPECSTEYCVELFAQSCEGDVYGCTDPEAINYNPNATLDDGSCIYDSDCDGFEGIFSLNSNYEYSGWWEILNTETGEYVVGDSIPADVQYNSDFCLEDGCYNIQLNLFSDSEFNASVYVVVGGEIVILEFLVAGEYNVDFQVGSGCSDEEFGCTDPDAINYNPDATIDDGSCNYECDDNSLSLIIETGTWAEEISWIISQDGIELYGDGVYENDSEYTYNLCLEDGCYTFEMYDSFGDGWNGATYTITFGDETLASGSLLSGSNGSVNFGINTDDCVDEEEIFGCTDPEAVNFNPNANVDDGSCIYEFECNIGFSIIPDTTGENTIWIVPTFNVDNLVEILWDFGDGTTSTEIFPAHEYAGDGPYTLCLTATLESEGTTCQATFCAELSGTMIGSGLVSSGFMINVIPNSTLSVTDTLDTFSINLYPNPATTQLNLSFESKRDSKEILRIYDATGKVVYEQQFNVIVGKNQKVIDIEYLSNGLYILSLKNVSNKRFVKSD